MSDTKNTETEEKIDTQLDNTEQTTEQNTLSPDDIRTSHDAIKFVARCGELMLEKNLLQENSANVLNRALAIVVEFLKKEEMISKVNGKVFVVDTHEAKTEQEANVQEFFFDQEIEKITEDKRTSVSLPVFKLEKPFTCFTNGRQLKGSPGDYVLKLSDNFYLPLKISTNE
jgi:hypothetical protein